MEEHESYDLEILGIECVQFQALQREKYCKFTKTGNGSWTYNNNHAITLGGFRVNKIDALSILLQLHCQIKAVSRASVNFSSPI